jgi:hypothetical protein
MSGDDDSGDSRDHECLDDSDLCDSHGTGFENAHNDVTNDTDEFMSAGATGGVPKSLSKGGQDS